ncbi:NAD(P)H-dependent FMN reductase [Winogradskyella wandonensis]|uniref:NAD(P)H-dependent FMN reductase n=1 Tax=Winogradskyella wandonensis TaxID=1442586 RepID=A0A4V2PU55_9FLAO|nr:NAD(P)H-dependent oxidoreductase [Winogradskyella wandonensis]TCK69171.1 NAD(P)H-dependent FMN reductase [Winogradskyella wandonensis]
MKKIIVIGGSLSKTSINKQLATYASTLVNNVEVKILDLNDYEMPLYSPEREDLNGQPKEAKDFVNEIKNADGIIISLAEYNGSYTAAFKNTFDWASRVEVKTFQNKPMLLMATSPGARGGQNVLAAANNRFPIHAANIVAKFSLPSFGDNFENGKITNNELYNQLLAQIKDFENAL